MASAQSAVAILKQVMAKASSAPAASSMASSAASSVAVFPTASSTTSPVVVSASVPIQQYLPMPLPSVISVQDEGERIIGGVAIEAREGTKRKPHGRSTDSQKRRPRTCKRCKTYQGDDGNTCAGRHPCHGEAGCEFFTAVGARKKRAGAGAKKRREQTDGGGGSKKKKGR